MTTQIHPVAPPTEYAVRCSYCEQLVVEFTAYSDGSVRCLDCKRRQERQYREMVGDDDD